MPRQRRGAVAPARSAPSRPTAAPARPHVTPPQQSTRPNTTAAYPAAPATATQQPTGKNPSIFGQMASTAAGVAVGSSIGHAVGGWFSSQPTDVPASDSAVASQAQNGLDQSSTVGRNCEVDAKAFTRCLDENKGSEYQMSVCGWYLEQLKACQQAATQY